MVLAFEAVIDLIIILISRGFSRRAEESGHKSLKSIVTIIYIFIMSIYTIGGIGLGLATNGTDIEQKSSPGIQGRRGFSLAGPIL